MTMEQIILTKLQNSLSPEYLEVINDSHKHQGHKGSPNTGHSHFTIKISAKKFAELSKVQAHRVIYDILADELKTDIHALSIKVLN